MKCEGKELSLTAVYLLLFPWRLYKAIRYKMITEEEIHMEIINCYITEILCSLEHVEQIMNLTLQHIDKEMKDLNGMSDLLLIFFFVVKKIK